MWKKEIIIFKSKNEVYNDLSRLTEKTENFNGLGIFYGEIEIDSFSYSNWRSISLFSISPTIKGEIIEKNEKETIIKLKVDFPIVELIIWGFCISLYLLVFSKEDYNLNIINMIISIMFIIHWIIYIYNFRVIINDFELYKDGYFDKYIN
jgi:hypothetical protein